MRTVVVVPWRGGDPDRENAWRYVYRWWSKGTGLDVIRVDHDEGPFNRSWCINEGARRAGNWDFLIAADADSFEDNPAMVADAITVAAETGKLVVPHTSGADLTPRGRDRLLARDREWRSEELAAFRPVCTSRVWVIPRALFEEMGGFDSRFQGWGHEDVAAWGAATMLRGAPIQLPGTCWHLWHRPSLPLARPTAEWRAGHDLAERYMKAMREGWPVFSKLMQERTAEERYDPPSLGDKVDVVVISAGRTDYLTRTMASFEERVTGNFGHRTIQDDSGDPVINGWLRSTWPDWEINTTPGKLGYTGAMRAIWAYEGSRNGKGNPWVFHLEEDFTFDRDVDLGDLIRVLEFDPTLAQVALLRQPWAPREIRAGGIIEQKPETYERLDAWGVPYLRHRNFWTTNPSLYRRTLIDDGWPDVRGSEQTFGRGQWAKGRFASFIGDGTPWVTHIGDERVGIGY